jgi:hypothetical protein
VDRIDSYPAIFEDLLDLRTAPCCFLRAGVAVYEQELAVRINYIACCS